MRLLFLDHDVLGGINEAPMKFVGAINEVPMKFVGSSFS